MSYAPARKASIVSLEYSYPDDTPTREELEQAEADRDPPTCICENEAQKLYNPDCYWHGTEGLEIITPLCRTAHLGTTMSRQSAAMKSGCPANHHATTAETSRLYERTTEQRGGFAGDNGNRTPAAVDGSAGGIMDHRSQLQSINYPHCGGAVRRNCSHGNNEEIQVSVL